MLFLSPSRIRSIYDNKPGRRDVLGLVTQQRKAWPWLCDTLGHINNARYIDLLQDGRLEWLIQNGLLRAVIRKRMAFLVAGMGGVYRHDIPRMADFVLHTRVCAFDERWLYYEQTFRLGRDGEGKIAARFITRGMIRAREGALPPRESLRRCGGHLPEQSPAAPSDMDAWCQAQDACLDVLRSANPSTAAV
jgi:acyl-CoA thioesterase FadM